MTEGPDHKVGAFVVCRNEPAPGPSPGGVTSAVTGRSCSASQVSFAAVAE